MALSSWDTWAVDGEGNPCDGSLTSFLGVEVEFYKNWIYVRDTKAWDKASGWAEPTVMEVQHGSIHYKDVTIRAMRGPKQGIYAVVESKKYHRGEDGKAGTYERRIMIGIGCYGYSDDGEFVGVEQEEIDVMREWINTYDDDTAWHKKMFCRNDEDEKDLTQERLAEWETFKSKMGSENPDWYKHYLFEKHIRSIPLDRGQRFNQGDAFFASSGILNILPATDPGNASDPAMNDICKQILGPAKNNT